MDNYDFEQIQQSGALNAIHEEALKLFGSQKLSKELDEGLALIIAMARYKQDLRGHDEWNAGATVLDSEFTTEIGDTSLRTLSHHLGIEFPVSTVFLTEDPFGEETLVGFQWNTSKRPDLLRIHDRLVACMTKNGFAPFKEAANQIQSSDLPTHQAGKEKLKQLLPISLGIYLQSIA